MEASAPAGDGDWDIVNQAISGSTIPLGPEGVLTVKVTWEANQHLPASSSVGGVASYFTTSSSSNSNGGCAREVNPDVDISAICFAADGTALEAVFFNHTKSISSRVPGAIELVSGDQSSGHTGEEMRLQLEGIPARVATIALVVTSANSVPLSSVKGICMSASLTGQSATGGFICDHLTWQEEDFPTSKHSLAAGAAAAVPPPQYGASAGGGVSRGKAPPQYGGSSTAATTPGDRTTTRVNNGDVQHSVSVPLTLTLATKGHIPSHGGWQLNVVSHSIPNAQSFVDALPKIRLAAQLPEGGGTSFKIPVNLEKGEELLLQGDQTHCPIHVGCGWDEDTTTNSTTAPACDADLSVLFLGGGGASAAFDPQQLEILETIYWGKLTGFDGAVLHSGDNQTGHGEGDDESIVLNLSHLPATVTSIMFVVSNYNDGGLKTLRNVHFRIVRLLDDAEVVRYEGIGSDGNGDYSGFIPCSLTRGINGTDWRITCHAAPIRGGKTVHDPEVKQVVARLLVDAQGGATVKPVNFRRSLKEATNRSVGGDVGGKTSAPLPDCPSKPCQKDNLGTETSGAAHDGVPLPIKVLFFLFFVFVLKILTLGK